MICKTYIQKTTKSHWNKLFITINVGTYSWIGRFNIVTFNSVQIVYRCNIIPIKSSYIFFLIDKMILKFLQKSQGFRIAKAILKKNKTRILMLPNGEAYYKAIKTKTRILTLPNREAYCKAIKTKTLWSWNRVKK